MIFFDLKHIATLIGVPANDTSMELAASIAKKLQTEPQLFESKNIPNIQLQQFLLELKKDNSIIFYDWVMTNPGLKKLLLEHQLPKATIDNKRFQGHLLEKHFYDFLTPFLYPILEKAVRIETAQDNFTSIAGLMSASLLLDHGAKLKFQQIVRDYFLSLLQKRFEFSKSQSEDSIMEQVLFVKNKSVIDAFNLFDKSYYTIRIELVKNIGKLANHRNISFYALNVIKPALIKLELNPRHRNELAEFFHETTQVKTTKIRRSGNLIKSLLFILFAVGLVLLLIQGVYHLNPEKKTPTTARHQTGLDSLTSEELVVIDSLLGLKIESEDKDLEQLFDIQQPIVPAFVFPEDFIKNPSILSLHKSMITDFGIQEKMYSLATCKTVALPEYKLMTYSGILETDQLSGPYHKIRNESDYDVYLLLFENRPNGKAYGRLIPKRGSVNIGIKNGMNAFFYIGNDMAKFNPAKDYNKGYNSIQTAQEVDKTFDHHFCDMDHNTLLQLQKIYKIDVSNLTLSTKLKGNYSDGFEVDSKVIVVEK